jgi:hypothetical protein
MTVMERVAHTPMPATRPRLRSNDGVGRLTRVLTAHAARAGCTVSIDIMSAEPWASATFTGTVATLALAFEPGPAMTRWLADLPEADLPMGRDLVADIAVAPAAGGCCLSVLICSDAANGSA